jgi:protein required for attachment to host cells
MHLNSAQIKQATIIWVLVANGRCAQIFRYHKNKKIILMHDSIRHPHEDDEEQHELTLVPGMTLEAESLDNFQVGHDGRGSLVGGQFSAHNTCEPHLDIRDEIKQNLVSEIVIKLKQANESRAFDQLVIVASPKILGLLRQHIGDEISGRVIAEIAKDFTNDDTHVLLAHLQKSMNEIHIG